MTCCGADAHPLCKAVFLSKKILVPKCPVCDCHLHQNGKLHTDFCGAADYIYIYKEGGEKKPNSSKNGKRLFIHPIFVT